MFDDVRYRPPAMDEEEVESIIGGKLSILPGHQEDLSAATFVLFQEDHTLGTLLQYMIMKNPDVEFCGYTMPHPSEHKIHLRIQMYDNKSSLVALQNALSNLEELFGAICDTYDKALSRAGYDQTETSAND